jgi:hypothetical protein
MPANPPLTAAGRREPKRTRPIPRKVREACDLMVYGRRDDEDCKPLDFIEAGKACDIAPDIMRRWLDRAQVRAYLLASRRTFREAICAGNEGALQRIRDKSLNGMAVIASVRALEQLDEETNARPANAPTPGVTIRIVNVVQQGAPAAPAIDVTPPRPALPQQRVPLASERQYPVFRGGPSDDALQVDGDLSGAHDLQSQGNDR